MFKRGDRQNIYNRQNRVDVIVTNDQIRARFTLFRTNNRIKIDQVDVPSIVRLPSLVIHASKIIANRLHITHKERVMFAIFQLCDFVSFIILGISLHNKITSIIWTGAPNRSARKTANSSSIPAIGHPNPPPSAEKTSKPWATLSSNARSWMTPFPTVR